MTRILHVNETNTAWLLSAACLADVFDDPLEPDALNEFVQQGNHALFVACDGDQVIGQIRGMIVYQPDAGADLYIDNLGVAGFYRRQGVATALYEVLFSWAKGTLTKPQDVLKAWVMTEPENKAARAFYTRLGLANRACLLFE